MDSARVLAPRDARRYACCSRCRKISASRSAVTRVAGHLTPSRRRTAERVGSRKTMRRLWARSRVFLCSSSRRCTCTCVPHLCAPALSPRRVSRYCGRMPRTSKAESAARNRKRSSRSRMKPSRPTWWRRAAASSAPAIDFRSGLKGLGPYRMLRKDGIAGQRGPSASACAKGCIPRHNLAGCAGDRLESFTRLLARRLFATI